MKFSCNRAELATILGKINNVIPVRNPRPVLQNVHLEATKEGSITFSGTDLEIGMAITMAVDELEEPQSVLVNSSLLTGIISEDVSERISFNITPEKACIKTDRGEFELAISMDAFPEIKGIEDDNFVTVTGGDLQEAVERTRFAVSHSDGKYTFNGICVNFENDKMDFVASDGNRLSLVTKPVVNPKGIANLALVICKGMTELARISGRDDQVDIQFTGNEMIARVGNVRLFSRLLEGKFPQYGGVIPQETPLKLTVGRQELINGLRLVNRLSTEDVRSVSLDGANGKLVLSLNSGACGSARYELDAVVEGGEISTAFNCNYMVEAANSFKGKDLVMDFVQNGKPMVIREGSYVHVITPVNKV